MTLESLEASESILSLRVQETLSDYITTIAWSPIGNMLAVASGDGEVRLFQDSVSMTISPRTGLSIDVLAFSSDGQWLAAGGQNGAVMLWQMDAVTPIRIDRMVCASWVDRLVWHPSYNQFAFNQGKAVQIWDADQGEAVIQLDHASMLQDIRWSPDGQHLAIATQNNVYIWNAQDWTALRYQWELTSPISSIAWSADSHYLASALHDSTVSILSWSKIQSFQSQPMNDRDLPILLRGFPGKIRRLAWSDFPSSVELPPILAAATRELVIMWMPTSDDGESWVLDWHNATVLDVAFQPKNGLLASLSEDGWMILWQAAVEVSEAIEGPKAGFSCLAWHPQGTHLAAGGQRGEVLIWSIPQRCCESSSII